MLTEAMLVQYPLTAQALHRVTLSAHGGAVDVVVVAAVVCTWVDGVEFELQHGMKNHQQIHESPGPESTFLLFYSGA